MRIYREQNPVVHKQAIVKDKFNLIALINKSTLPIKQIVKQDLTLVL